MHEAYTNKTCYYFDENFTEFIDQFENSPLFNAVFQFINITHFSISLGLFCFLSVKFYSCLCRALLKFLLDLPRNLLYFDGRINCMIFQMLFSNYLLMKTFLMLHILIIYLRILKIST